LAVIALMCACAGCATIKENYASMREGLSSMREDFAAWREAFWRDAFEDPARVDRIAAGSMNKQQVRELLGEPNMQKSLNGEETWTYKSYRTIARSYVPLSNAKGGSMQSLEVTIVFSPDGVVKKTGTDKQQW
jgi:outer membrane protein assembly factor BamE (lipoprotein component of BamABCDE complex)